MSLILARRLADTLRKKEDIESFQTNLRRLKEEGTVDQGHYNRMMETYNGNLQAMAEELSELQLEMSRELESGERELTALREELTKLEVRMKVGELAQPQFNRSSRPIQKRIQTLVENNELCMRLREAKSSADLEPLLGRRAAKPASINQMVRNPSSLLPEHEAFTDFTSIEEMTTPRLKALGLLGGTLLLIGVLAKWISSENWAPISGADISIWLLFVGLLGAAGAIYASLLARSRARGFLHLVIAAFAALVALIVRLTYNLDKVVIKLGGGTTVSMGREALHYREGVYLYILAIALMFYYGIRETRLGD